MSTIKSIIEGIAHMANGNRTVSNNNKRPAYQASKYILAQYDRDLIERLTAFRNMSKNMTPADHVAQCALTGVWRDIILQLTPGEYQDLAESWSLFNLSEDATSIEAATGRIIRRVEAGAF